MIMSVESFVKDEQFYHFFQPILDLHTRRELGYEVLLRSKVYSNPEVAFQAAKKEKLLYELDTRSIYKAIATYHSADFVRKEETLFINIFPSTILNPNFYLFLTQAISEFDLKCNQFVLEISESESIVDFELFKNRIDIFRKDGFLIALDDIGKGYSSIKSIIELEPDYLKLDLYFTQNLHKSEKKQAFILAIQKFCKHIKSEIILEGIETEEELKMTKTLDIPFAQGYLLGRPTSLSQLNSQKYKH